MSKHRRFEYVLTAVSELDIHEETAAELGSAMEQYAKNSEKFHELMDVPEFSKLWQALESAATQSQERARILNAAEEIERRREPTRRK